MDGLAPVSEEDIRALEQVRIRFHNLCDTLVGQRNKLLEVHPLPPWPSIHSQTQHTSRHLLSLLTHITNHTEQLNTTYVVPGRAFPGSTHEMYLNSLLRKKLDPGAETWLSQGVSYAESLVNAAAGGPTNASQQEQTAALAAAIDPSYLELWDWAGPAANEVMRSVFQGDEEGDDEEEDEEEEGSDEEGGAGAGGKMEGVEMQKDGAGGANAQARPPIPIERLLKFMCTGNLE